jgi:NADH-quinone oxidoreductase subunit L
MTKELLITLTWLAPFPPIIAFMLIALFANKRKSLATLISVGGMVLTTIMSFIVFFNVINMKKLGEAPLRSQIPWIPTGSEVLNVGVAVDPLGATFLFMVPLTATLIFIYSTSYMGNDPRYTRFMAFLSLFAGSMMGLVVSDNMLSLFIFWELMGFCSYSLIGFFYFKPSAYKAAVKAFMTTRVGDMLLVLGMVYLYTQTGTLNFFDILHNEEVLHHLATTPSVIAGVSTAGLIGLLIFGGTVGKSAQFPLHVWLPDAMEGPTPVSAMIHAATMVSAGIFMALRFFALYESAAHIGDTTAFTIIGWIGAITALLGAFIAVGQYDIKRVLAYSTISQLGFMVAAIGIGGYIAATFHLLTHAFFKALLFLGSGSVIHGVEHGHHHLHGGGHGHDDHGHSDHDDHGATEHEFDPQDMRNMGGLWSRMPITFITFTIGGLALMGAPFITAGFWSKDEILAHAFYGMNNGNPLAMVVFWTLCIAATFTAFYTARQIFMTFGGEPRSEAAAHAKENPAAMVVPLIVLAFFAIFLGYANVPEEFEFAYIKWGKIAAGFGVDHWLGHFIETMLPVPEMVLPFNEVPVLFSVCIFLFGGFLGYWFYGRKPLMAGEKDPVENLGVVFTALNNRLYFDELYRKLFINPLQRLADSYSVSIDKMVIDTFLHAGYTILSDIAELFKLFDKYVVTGLSNLIGNVFNRTGSEGRELQTGQVQNYLFSALIALVVMMVFFLVFQ